MHGGDYGTLVSLTTLGSTIFDIKPTSRSMSKPPTRRSELKQTFLTVSNHYHCSPCVSTVVDPEAERRLSPSPGHLNRLNLPEGSTEHRPILSEHALPKIKCHMMSEADAGSL